MILPGMKSCLVSWIHYRKLGNQAFLSCPTRGFTTLCDVWTNSAGITLSMPRQENPPLQLHHFFHLHSPHDQCTHTNHDHLLLHSISGNAENSVKGCSNLCVRLNMASSPQGLSALPSSCGCGGTCAGEGRGASTLLHNTYVHSFTQRLNNSPQRLLIAWKNVGCTFSELIIYVNRNKIIQKSLRESYNPLCCTIRHLVICILIIF